MQKAMYGCVPFKIRHLQPIKGYKEGQLLPYLDYRTADFLVKRQSTDNKAKMASFSTAFLNHPNLWDVYDWPDDFQDELDFMADELDLIPTKCLNRIKDAVGAYIVRTQKNKVYTFCRELNFLNPYLFEGANTYSFMKPKNNTEIQIINDNLTNDVYMSATVNAVSPNRPLTSRFDFPDISPVVVEHIPQKYKNKDFDLSEFM